MKQLNKYFVFLVVCVAFASCTQGKYMTYDDYQRVAIGEKIADIQVQMGRPYFITERTPHIQEYVYVERLSLGDHREVFRKYILTVDHDKVVEKKVVEEISSPVQFMGS